MFCPKCGTENPDNGKFCRSCGIDLGNISAVVSGNLPQIQSPNYIDQKGKAGTDNPDDIYSSAIRSIFMGGGFFTISMALLFTGVAGGKSWWWALLFPAFSMLASGISQLIKVKRLEKRRNAETFQQTSFPVNQSNTALPPMQTNYINPESRFKTGDLAPRSVTDPTTKNLKIDSEGETMTLPSIKEQ